MTNAAERGTDGPGSGQPWPPEEVARAACSRVLAKSGLDLRLLSGPTTLSAGAVRASMLWNVDAAQRDVPSGASDQVVTQISKRSEGVNGDAAVQPLARIPARVEAAILQAVKPLDLPTVPLLAAGFSPELDADVLVSGFVSGESIPRRVLRQVAATDGGGAGLAKECGAALAELHTRASLPDVVGLPRLDQHRPYRAHIEDLSGRLDELSTPFPVLRYGLLWLAEHAPRAALEPCLVHGDFRLGNLLINDGQLKAVVDWELAHVGDPMCDLAWMCLRTWRFGVDELEVGGFAPLDALRAAYISSGGAWNEHRFDWWTVARTVWWGIGLAAQADAFMDEFAGKSDVSVVHAASGRRVVELEYDLLDLIGAHDGL